MVTTPGYEKIHWPSSRLVEKTKASVPSEAITPPLAFTVLVVPPWLNIQLIVAASVGFAFSNTTAVVGALHRNCSCNDEGLRYTGSGGALFANGLEAIGRTMDEVQVAKPSAAMEAKAVPPPHSYWRRRWNAEACSPLR